MMLLHQPSSRSLRPSDSNDTRSTTSHEEEEISHEASASAKRQTQIAARS